jgi:endo-1,4-beta-xylanase
MKNPEKNITNRLLIVLAFCFINVSSLIPIESFAQNSAADLPNAVESLDKGFAGSTTKPLSAESKFYQGPPLAQGLPKFLGNVMASDNIFANYWNQITPGNEGKWASVAGTSDSTKWNWTGLDAIYTYAKNHNLLFKDHTLIWGNQQPSWISSLDQAQQLKYIETWMRKVGQRYPGIDMIDVVNEPLVTHNPPDGVNGRANYKNALGGNGSTGWDWVINSFKMARKYLPNAKLLINDYGIINDNNATTNYLTIINLLKERGLVDGIGVQGHRFEFENASITTLKNNLDRLSATGLPVYITEMDLGNLNNSGTPDDNQQLQLYQKVFPVLWDHPGVKGITLWGYLEGEMWQSTCYLVLKNGTWRPAMQWIAQYIKTNITTEIVQLRNIETSDIKLEQNYPNPFYSTTKIIFSIRKPQFVVLKIYNNQGREVATLINKNLEAGNYSILWDAKKSLGTKLENGIYYYQLAAYRTILNKKMILLR